MTVNDDLGLKYKKVFVAYIEKIFQNFPGNCRGNSRKTSVITIDLKAENWPQDL